MFCSLVVGHILFCWLEGKVFDIAIKIVITLFKVSRLKD